MATFNFKLGRKKDNGKYPVCLLIRQKKTNTPITTKVEVIKSDWNSNSQRIVIRAKDTYDVQEQKREYNEELDLYMQVVKEVEMLLQRKGVLSELSAKQIKKFILEYNPNAKQVEGTGDFISYFNKVAIDIPKSKDKYESTLKTLITYSQCRGDISHQGIRFSDITPEFIRRYISYLREVPFNASKKASKLKYKAYSPATIKSYISIFKRVINLAIDDNKLSADTLKGFKGYKMPSESHEVFALTIEQIRDIMHYPLTEGSRLKMTRDLFIFSFCCRGMNLEDIFYLSSKNVKLPNISYVRKKTAHISQQRINICLGGYEDKVFEVIKPYTAKYNQWKDKCDDDYYFALAEHYFSWQGNKGYDNFSGYVQKDMRVLRKIFNLPDDFIFYTARHSFSTILSRDLNMGQEYVDASLGHSPKGLASKHYISIDIDKLNEAHTEVLRRLFG